MLTTSLARSRRAARTAATALLAVALAGAAGCGSDRTTGTHHSSSLTGAYSLQQIDGESLPVIVYDGPYYDPVANEQYDEFVLRVVRSTIELHADGSYAQDVFVNVNADGQVRADVQSINGRYAIRDDEIQFISSNSQMAPGLGTLRNGTITINSYFLDDPVSWELTYRK